MNSIIRQLTANHPLSQLIGDVDKAFVGYVYNLRYDEAFVQTNDSFKHAVNGLAHNSFLVAAGFDPSRFNEAPLVDQEVVLLRVLEPAPLPQDGDMVRTRIEHHQRRRADERLPGDGNDGLDPMTRSELQWGGLRCRVLGTFFMQDDKLRLGSDVETFMSLPRMRAYKPRGEALAMIVNHVNPEVRAKAAEEAKRAGFKDTPKPIEIGKVRYTSTNRLQTASEAAVSVEIQPADFLARRTAVLGMTRTGKSNTVKTTVSAVALAAMKSDIKVGQLIFDINGEYANATSHDDDSSIAAVFASTVRYRAVDTPPELGFHDLRINFYEQPDVAIGLLDQLSQDVRGNAQDITTFMTSSLEEPDQAEDRGAHNRWLVRRAAFFCVLNAARYRAPAGFMVDFPVGKDVLEVVQPRLPQDFSAPVVRGNNQKFLRLALPHATTWFQAARAANLDSPLLGSGSNKWVDSSLEATLNVLCNTSSGKTYIRGYRQLQEYTDYHSPRRQGDVVKEILQHLYDGRIVILDLSAGPVSIRKTLADRVALSIFNKQFDTLNSGQHPMDVVLYVEEAHNLIGTGAKLTDTWPRIAKEGAKARIAFVYATQEPSSVHANILANTENWFVTHLNNDDELKTLGKFYDFGDFLPSLKSAQDVGFARIKTLSAPFVIPTQIDRFTPNIIKAQIEAIEAARHAKTRG